MTEKPHAALLRENELLRSVAAKAIRLRRIGMQCEECSEALERLWKDNPEMTRSGTQGLMLDQAFKTAMDAFDLAVLRAADEGMDWTKDHGIPKPKLFASNRCPICGGHHNIGNPCPGPAVA